MTESNNETNINIHILFNPDPNNEILRCFLSKLLVDDKPNKYYNVSDINYDTCFVTIENIEKALKETPDLKRKDYLIVSAINGYGKVRDEEDGRNDNVLKGIRKKSDFYFGNENSNDCSIKQEKKPTLLCSDAHKIEYIDSKFTWIKAETTFEGLRQILFEPEQRVKIQKERPDMKDNYNLIDKIILKNKDNNGYKFSKEDGEKTIYFNQNLVSIIGEKSSGKSLLLYLIARILMDKEQYNKLYEKEKNEGGYENWFNKVDIIIFLKDNENEYKYNKDNFFENNKIKFIPQNYLNNSVKDDNAIEDIKKDIFNIFLNNNEELKNDYDKYKKSIVEIDNKISYSINDYFNKESSIKTKQQEKSLIGATKEQLEQNIKIYNQNKENLMKNFNDINELELKTYNENITIIANKNKEKIEIENKINKLNNFDFDNRLLELFRTYKQELMIF